MSSDAGLDQAASVENGWLTPFRFAVLLAVLVFVTFPGVVIGTRTFIFRDYGLFSYPVAFFQRQCFWRGELPLWNPYSQCGLPFLAQWNTLCLYPPALFYLLLPLTWALSFFCLAHLVWGGLGMFYLAREWTNNRLAAGLGGIIFAFNGLSLNFLMWPTHVATFSWFPWVLWLTPLAWQQGGRKLIGATMAGAMQMLAGGPETIILTWITLLLLMCGDWLSCLHLRRMQQSQDLQTSMETSVLTSWKGALVCWRRPSDLLGRFFGLQLTKIPARFLGITILVAVICAAQLLPFLELLAHSQRDTGFGAAAWAMPPWGWANFFIPLFRASESPQGVYLQPGQYWTSSYYAGIGTILLVAVAVWRARVWRVRLLAALVFLAMLLALGNSGVLYSALRALVPVIGFFRYPVKFVILILALAPLLAAVGFDYIISRIIQRTLFEKGCVAGMVMLIGFLVAMEWKCPAVVWQNAVSRAGLLLLIYILVILLRKLDNLKRGNLRTMLGLVLLTAFWADLVTHMPTQNPTDGPGVYIPNLLAGVRQWQPEPKIGASRAMLSPAAQERLKRQSIKRLDRTYLLQRLGLLANCNLLENVPQEHGFFSMAPAEINNATVIPYVETNRDFSPLLDFMGVSQITTPGQTFEWTARPTAMPLVTAGQAPVFASDPTVFGSFSQANLDLRKIVFLPPEARRLVGAKYQIAARVNILSFNDELIKLESHSTAAAMVVISQTWYPAWRAFMDGRPCKIWRANYAFQAVEVPAGMHEIQLRYEDLSLEIGAGLSIFGLAICCAVWWIAGRHPTKSKISFSSGSQVKENTAL